MKKIRKGAVITFIVIIILVVILINYNLHPPKLNDITSVRVEYNQRIVKTLSLNSQVEIKDDKIIEELVDCFNVKSSYEAGCDCPSHDIIIHFISEKREYTYNIGITGDIRIQYSEKTDKDIAGIDINSVIEILKQIPGSENLKYPIE